jgi:transposase
VDALTRAVHGGHRHHGVSGRAMLEALIVGQRDPKVLAELARGRIRGKRAALVAALHGRFDDHHAELARMLGDHIEALGIQIDRLTSRIQELIGAIPAAQPPGDGAGPSGAGTAAATTGTQDTDQPLTPTSNPTPLGALQRLDEVPGIGGKAAQVLIAELGLNMGQFPTPGQLVSWARLSPRTIQSGAKRRAGTTGKGNPYLKGVLGEVAAAAAKTDTFPWRALPPPGPAHRQAQGPGRRGPVHPGDRLAPAGRPHRPLPRPGRRLPRPPHRHRPHDPHPHPPAPGPRLHRHPDPGCLTDAGPQTRLTSTSTQPGSHLPTQAGLFRSG